MRITDHLPFTCLLVAFAACGGHGQNFGGPDGSSTDTGTTNNDGGPMFNIDGSADSGGCTQCSADLHSVLTCGTNPVVVQTCTGNTGCGSMGCEAACPAAADNKSSVGCDYYAMPSDGWNTNMGSDGTPGSCFAAYVANNWSTRHDHLARVEGHDDQRQRLRVHPDRSRAPRSPTQASPPLAFRPTAWPSCFSTRTSPRVRHAANTPRAPRARHVAVTNEDMVIHSHLRWQRGRDPNQRAGHHLRHLPVRRRPFVHPERDAALADDGVGRELRSDHDVRNHHRRSPGAPDLHQRRRAAKRNASHHTPHRRHRRGHGCHRGGGQYARRLQPQRGPEAPPRSAAEQRDQRPHGQHHLIELPHRLVGRALVRDRTDRLEHAACGASSARWTARRSRTTRPTRWRLPR